ncbi:MAG: hypothetical protein A2534_00930 [Candidatus Magasanikbacteria bacterium RIFOXYD2_FULL_39_9]|uniref:Glycosyltransferase 2-like domain-containing protein n=1 Tax=Candidatus Magasanikbacteria bacterium RIFOXYD1_FULL_40_23 TaxID=1798705 RepID=A0A1F6PAR7_9BACT|nr:MAG: hypothetical protein A2534_00930 [Candidatus Magasanikbacteria bacterium RIFOXYD2_FULL_39_9]OGH93259.1 MAG: hypothetical protein A2563_01485 [Candidatus Magasanikbacteria bacterium RIFOXYD1_FULL_40_23]
MQPLISVIIPVYNHAHTLKTSIEGIFRQTYRPLEVIVVDDGSTDNFEEAVKECLALTEKECIGEGSLLSVISQPNAGAPAARNRGFAASKGEYVIFWDADTISDPNMLQKMYKALQNNPQAVYAYSQFKFGWKTFKSQEFNSEKLKQINYIDVTSLIRRKDFVGFDEKIKRFQDWDLWLSMLEQGKIGVFVPEVLYKKIVAGRVGISNWLPSFFYKLPWKSKQVQKYDDAKEIIVKKHKLV